jgi:hypothetical protein
MSVEYNLWADSRNRAAIDPPLIKEGTLPVGEFMQWQKAKAAWRQVEKRVDAEYRGDHR